MLVDGAAYFGALRDSLRKARRSIFIVGWDIDSRTRLVGASGTADDGLPETLGPFLTELVKRRPELKIHILLWDYSMLYALDREPLPSVNLDWKTPKQVAVCLDDVLPVGASHHQKIVVIDDSVAYSGGLDLTIRRWDTSAHQIGSGDRVDPSDEPYRPFHDVQIVVDGGTAAALGELVRHRWRNAACEKPIALKPVGYPWPEGVEADFEGADVGIARTFAPFDGKEPVREVEALFKRAIETAEDHIYIENQYLTSQVVAECLIERLKANESLEVLIVGPNVHHSWLEERSMNAGRRRTMARIEEEGLQHRVRLTYPAVPGDDTGEGVMVHAKIMVVDDRFLRVGSANLNNRSMGTDSECDLALEAQTADQRKAISRVRDRLLSEHMDTTPEAIARAVESHGSLLAAVDHLSNGDRSLRPIDLSGVPEDDIALAVSQVADPERPITTPDFAGDLFGAVDASTKPTHIVTVAAAAFAILAMVLAWHFTPVASLTNPSELARWLQRLGSDFWMPLLVPAAFVLGGLLLFPVTVLIAVVGMMFGPVIAFAYGVEGSLLSALVTYFIGRQIGRGPLREFAGKRVNRVSRALAQQGIISVTALRMVPIAPFTVVNMVAGASHIRTLDFLVGTFLGMAPGMLIVIFLGHQLGRVLQNPATADVALLILAFAAWLFLAIALQILAKKLRSRHDG